MVYETKRWIRESVMQGEGSSTPHIHRTRWDPFSSCVCSSANDNCYLISNDRERRRKKDFVFYIILSLPRFQNLVPTYSLVQWESQNSVVLLENEKIVGWFNFRREWCARAQKNI